MMNSCFVAPLAVDFQATSSKGPLSLRSHPATSVRLACRPWRASAVTTPSDASQSAPSPISTNPSDPLFQCPECKQSYPPIAPLQLRDFPHECSNCGSKVLHRDGFIDLTKNTPQSASLLRSLMTLRPSQTTFQLPIVSYAYERGWRNNFRRAGFPGIEAEFDYFLDFAAPADVVLDVSCGSGLMARRLATSGCFNRVVATDYSVAMMRETVAQARKDVTVPEFDVVRADVTALPFVDNSVDAVHCGAALHCWPSVQDGLAEIFRVLKPGGKFFATTFLKLAYVPLRDRLAATPRVMKAAVRLEELTMARRMYRFFEVDELEFLLKAAGLGEVSVETMKACAITRSTKPERP